MKRNPVYGNHIGIVINQEDPEYRGRVQIYVPYLTNTIYAGWNQDLKDKKFKNLGNGGDLIPEVVEKLKNVLPWAECAAPIFGGGTSATYNPSTGRISTNPYKTVGKGPVNPAQQLNDPSQKGLMAEAERLRDQGNRNFNFGNYERTPDGEAVFRGLDGNIYKGGRCLTAVGCLAGAGLQLSELAQPTGTGGIPEAQAVASGQNKFFQNSGMYKDPVQIPIGYNPKMGDILAMQGGSSGQGHIIICTGYDSNNNPIFMSDDASENYNRYLSGNSSYYNVRLLEPTPEGTARWSKTMNQSLPGSSELGTPTAPNAATAAEVAATAVNPNDKATGGDSTVKDVSVPTQQRTSSLNTASNKVDPQQLYNTIYDHLKTKLGNNPVPQDVANYGVSADLNGLTTLMMKAAYKESGFENNAGGDETRFFAYDANTGQKTIQGGSYGLFQMSPQDAGTYKHLGFRGQGDGIVAWTNKDGSMGSSSGANPFTVEQLRDPNFNTDLATSIWADSIIKSGNVGNKTLKDYGWIADGEVPKLNRMLKENPDLAGLTYTGPGGIISSVSKDNSLTSPYPNYNAGNTPAHYQGAQASGMVSIPKPGAKVFLFFLGGDIQKPVYFASVLEPETVRKSLETVSSNYGKEYDSSEETIHTDFLGNGPAKVTLTSNQGFINGIPKDESSISIGTNGSGLQIAPGATRLNNNGDYTGITMGGSYETVNGPRSSFSGPSFAQVGGDHTVKVGEFDEKQIKAAENLHKLLKETQTEKVKNIEDNASKGEKVPCPICSVSYPVDKATSAAKRLFSFLRKLGTLPWFTYSIDLLEFIASIVMIPFFIITQAKNINGGSCGNPDCKNGQVPSPQKPIQEANRIAAERLQSQQKEIAELEQQLGNGGSHSVVATKDIVLSAGLLMDDQPVYSSIGKMSHGCIVGPAKNAKGVHIVSSTGVPQVMHTEATQMPGGNIMLRGGSKIQLVAGSPGIEMYSKGKITIGAGSVEIISGESDLLLTSPTHTILKGNGVTIDADDKSGKGGGLVINANQTKARGLGVTGNMMLAGGLNMKGELSCTYLNTVGERVQGGSGSTPDQRVPFVTWAVGSLQTNDILNTTRTASTHFAMPGALLNITNIVKLFQQLYNTLYTSSVIEPTTTGYGIGIGFVNIWNWHHNHTNEPEDHHHEYTRPRGTYYDDEAGVHQSGCEASHIPTKARKKGTGPDGGPKTLAGCGGFGFNGAGQTGRRSFNLNSFGIADQTSGFTNTRLSDNNVKFSYNKDGTIKVILPNTTVKC